MAKQVLNTWGLPVRVVSAKSDPVSRTIKSHAKGLTVNEIMKRFATTRTIPDRGVPPVFLDTTVVPNMFDALNMRVGLNNYFNGLDSQTRALFKNNPMKLVEFVNDPKNLKQGLDLGLLKLNEKGQKAKEEWDKVQAKLAVDRRKAFEANVSQILRDLPGTGLGKAGANAV